MPEDDDYRRRIGERIHKVRKRAGLTQHELAVKLDVYDSQISRWETGKSAPSVTHMRALERALEVPAETFLRSDEDEDERP